MTEDMRADFDAYIEEIAARDVPPYEPRPGDQSIFAGITDFAFFETRDQRLSRPIRAFTLDWLAWELAFASQRSIGKARQVLVDAIPHGDEDVLDGGCAFIFAVDQAATMLGCDPQSVQLRPQQLHS